MPGKIAGASVLGAVVFQESRGRDALVLLGGDELYVPTILAYELTSIARKKALRDPDQIEHIADVLSAAFLTGLRGMDVDHQQVRSVAVETGLSVYDVAYLHIARVMGLPLVTFDEELRQAADETTV